MGQSNLNLHKVSSTFLSPIQTQPVIGAIGGTVIGGYISPIWAIAGGFVGFISMLFITFYEQIEAAITAQNQKQADISKSLQDEEEKIREIAGQQEDIARSHIESYVAHAKNDLDRYTEAAKEQLRQAVSSRKETAKEQSAIGVVTTTSYAGGSRDIYASGFTDKVQAYRNEADGVVYYRISPGVDEESTFEVKQPEQPEEKQN